MKLMIASDIHGSAYWCGKLVEAFRREGGDKLLLLGDILYHGPRNDLPKDYNPKEVFALLNDLKEHIYCVKGNCDSEVDQMVLEFPIMTEYALFEIDRNDEGKACLLATHGHKINPETPEQIQVGTYLINGHTHVPACDKYDGFKYLNPGSTSLPKEDSPHSYMIIEGGKMEWKRLDSQNGEVYKECVVN